MYAGTARRVAGDLRHIAMFPVAVPTITAFTILKCGRVFANVDMCYQIVVHMNTLVTPESYSFCNIIVYWNIFYIVIG